MQAFLRPGAQLQPGVMPGLPPGTQLSLPDAVRLRDRATILARQLYAAPDGAGPAVADQQVGGSGFRTECLGPRHLTVETVLAHAAVVECTGERGR